MPRKEKALETVKTLFGAGLWMADLAIRQAEAVPIGGHVVTLGRYVAYKAGTKAVFDSMVETQRKDMQAQIEKDLLAASHQDAGLLACSAAQQELEALQRFVELHGPKTYDEFAALSDVEGEPPQLFPTHQLDKFLEEAAGAPADETR